MPAVFRLVVTVCAASTLVVQVARAAVPENARCLDCHGQPHIAGLSPQDRRTMVAPGVAPGDGRPALDDEPPPRPGIFIENENV